ncbi:MAG: hypothetical protein LBB11_03470 [Puniceicoccales bacterium]|nr:hypothetical protein [Puniceicoccales bacterium]
MTNWINIEISDLYAYLVAVQVDALRKCALGKEQSDPVLKVIQDITLKIRAQIASNRRNTLSQRPYALPPELKSEACILILEAAQMRLPGLKLTTDQIRLADQARLQLEKIVRGEVAVTFPEDHLPGPPKSLAVVHYRPQIATGYYLRGL